MTQPEDLHQVSYPSLLSDLVLLETDSRRTFPCGIPPGASETLDMYPHGMTAFTPLYAQGYAYLTRRENGTTSARPVLLTDARVGTIPILRHAKGGVDTAVCWRGDIRPVDWPCFTLASAQHMKLSFYNPNETAVHVVFRLYGVPDYPSAQTSRSRQKTLTLIGATSLGEFQLPKGVPPQEELSLYLDAGDTCGLVPRFARAEAYNYLDMSGPTPVTMTRGWCEDAPLIPDQERGGGPLIFNGSDQPLDWPFFTSIHGQGLDLRLKHDQETPAHIFVSLLCEIK